MFTISVFLSKPFSKPFNSIWTEKTIYVLTLDVLDTTRQGISMRLTA